MKPAPASTPNNTPQPLLLIHPQWELTVGIEIHAELNTSTKLFSPANTSLSAKPNTHVAPFDAALPGAQPQFQTATLLPALRAALALDCTIQPRSSWDRKHYFWWDQPQGYQITQYYSPFARNGRITLFPHDDIGEDVGPKGVTIGIKQIQMEQDTAKTVLQPPATHLIDYNRVGTPLVEIITLPQIRSAKTAAALVRKVQSILKAVSACTTGMEMGGLRADVNVSARSKGLPSPLDFSYAGVSGLGQRTELKNLSSTKAIEDAVTIEFQRQVAILSAGGSIQNETRGYTIGASETRRLRGKEGEDDYRYMPDPDLPPLLISDEVVEALRLSLPELPDRTLRRLTLAPSAGYGLKMKDAKTLLALDDGARLEYYFCLVERLETSLPANNPSRIRTTAANWILHEVGALLAAAETPWTPESIDEAALAEVLSHLLCDAITLPTAKALLGRAFSDALTGADIVHIIDAEGLKLSPLSEEDYARMATELVIAHADMADKARSEFAASRATLAALEAGERGSQSEGGRGEADQDKSS